MKLFLMKNAMLNLHFPSIDLENLKKFDKKFLNAFREESNKVSILAYDALGLIYYCWFNNNFQFKTEQLYNKKGFKGLQGEFFIQGNLSHQKLSNYSNSYEPPKTQPYYAKMGISTNNDNGGSGGKLMERINYMIHLLEAQQYEKTDNITEEFILYTFLGVFVIFVVDSFAKTGKYTR